MNDNGTTRYRVETTSIEYVISAVEIDALDEHDAKVQALQAMTACYDFKVKASEHILSTLKVTEVAELRKVPFSTLRAVALDAMLVAINEADEDTDLSQEEIDKHAREFTRRCIRSKNYAALLDAMAYEGFDTEYGQQWLLDLIIDDNA